MDKLQATTTPSRVDKAETYFVKHGVNVFQCPLCSKLFRHDDAYEPLCTGPNPSLDEHEPTVMVFVRKDSHGRYR